MADNYPLNKTLIEKDASLTEVQRLQFEIDAAFEIIEDLPVDAHDMGVHFWCDPKNCYVYADLF